jgi:isocitrate dehydrogenase (NAD+)
MRTIALIQGGGVGLEQEASVRAILAAARVPIQFEVYKAGQAAIAEGQEPLAPAMLEAARRSGAVLKTKLLPPKDGTNFNIAFRKALGLFASVRPVHNLQGLPARFSGVNFLLVREITEDLYTASEHEVVPGVVQSFKIVTAAASLRFFQFAFQLASKLNRKTVHCIHKANILKLADGLYLECFRKVATEFPTITAKEMIVDNACMQMVSKPTQFDVVAAGNMYGDLLSDLGAGLVGGISATSAVHYGQGVTVYDAVYGASHELVPPGTANPLPLIIPTLELLKDLGETAAAARILKAVEAVLSEGTTKPADLGGTASTDAFTQAIVAKL